MTYLLWNCRGLGSDTVVRALRGLIQKHRPTMIFLSETKMKDHRLDGIRRRLGYSNGFHVPPVGRAGGLSLWWQDSLRVIVVFSSKHVIDVCYYLEEVGSWVRGTFVYGTSYRAEKVEFWNWLQNSFGPTDIPWLCGGDFNEFMWDSEKSGGTSVLYNRPTFLSNFLSAAELMDLGFIGPKFTWRGIRAGHLIEERLDRVAVNVRWQDLWPNSVVVHESAIGSDHCPVVVQSKPPFRKGKRPFRFEAFWAKEADCRDVVQNSWSLQGKDNWVKWLREGANTAFFHSTTLQRRRLNKVAKFKGDDGLWVEEENQVLGIVEDHFQALFTSAGSRDWGDTIDCIVPLVSDGMNAELIKQVSDEEIKDAVFQMGGLKAPGPHGFQGIFFHSYWDIILAEVKGLVGDFMRGVGISKRINSTHIVLIPKVASPESVAQYRPISLCNFSFKILSKVLANRLKPLLPELISLMQNAFVSDRQIQDNIGIAHELFHFLKLRKTKRKFELGIKIDMHKAYDRVEWDFLEAVLLKLGFCRGWTNLIMNCVTTVEFAVLLNGKPGQRFTPSRGIRQGDPLSPYLFLLFHSRNELVSDPGDYLGLPAIWGRSKRQSLAYVKGRMLGKVQGWKQSSLSLAGKEVLIKAVLQAIPSYPMNLFKFPKAVCNDLDSIAARFWWGDSADRRKIHWMSWDRLSRPKCDGGLGFRNFQDFNDALLVKQCWRLIHNPNSLWARTLKARYFPYSSFLDAKLGSRASWAWASLLVGRDILKAGAHWQILNGRDTRLWIDRWLPSLPLGHPVPRGNIPVSVNMKVSSLIRESTGSWDIEFLHPFISEEEITDIHAIHLGSLSSCDRLIWPLEKGGCYSVRSGYHWLHSRRLGVGASTSSDALFWKGVWKIDAHPKIRNFIWRAINEMLSTMCGLFLRRSTSLPVYPICKSQEESVVHMLLLCPWVAPVWFGGQLGLRFSGSGPSSFLDWFKGLFLGGPYTEDRSRIISVFAFSCWHIWKARCNFVFNAVAVVPSQVMHAISFSVASFWEAKTPCFQRVTSSIADLGLAPRWCPPPYSFIKINVDASWSPVDGKACLAAVLRDHVGQFVAAHKIAVAVQSALFAEAMAMLRGCELAAKLGFQRVITESDSLEVVSSLRGDISKGRWEVFPILQNILSVGVSFQDCRWSWVPRLANQAADLLASRKNMEMCDHFWDRRPPSSLVHILDKDGLPCPP
nr:uncharacterized protein LOC103417751 [Malus domestica]